MTEMEQLRDAYFHECEELLEKNHVYRNHINKFIDYLKEKEVSLLSDPLLIDKETVKRCVDFYRNKGQMNSLDTMMSHLNSLKHFYKYLKQNKDIPDIFYGTNYKDLKDKLVNEYQDLNSSNRGIYDENDIKKILFKLDEEIDEFESDIAGIREEERHLQRIILRLFIKLTLIAPAKKSVITNIKKSDITEKYKKLSINGIIISIPCGLSRDLCSALEYVESKNEEQIKEEDNLFEYLYRYKGKFRVESLNTWFYNIAKDFKILKEERRGKMTLAVEPIRNMAIQTMIQNKVNPVSLSEITGLNMISLEKMYRENTINSGEEIDKINLKLESIYKI